MQAEENILQRIAGAYVAHRSARPLCLLGALGAGVLLVRLTDGFPPFAWRLLAQVLPSLPALTAARGPVTLLALLGLVLLSLTILLVWGALLWLCWRMLAYWRYERQELRQFAEDAAEAHSLADDGTEDEDAREATAGRRNREARYGRPLASYSRYPLALPEPDEDDVALDWQASEDVEDEEEQAPGQASASRMLQQAPMPGPGDISLAGVRAAPTDQRRAGPGGAASVSSLPTQPMPPVSLRSALNVLSASGSRTIERAGQVQSSNYGRVVPFVAPTSGYPHPPTGYYNHVPLPLSVLVTAPMPVAPQPATRLIVSTGLDAGLKRKDRPNEDSLLALQNTRLLRGSACPVGLFVVADGMGGHSNGQEASRLVIQTLSKTVVPSVIYGPSDDNYAELLAEGVHHANLEVYQRNRQEKANMGTTIVAALVVDTTAYVVSAGDSRVYLYRASSGLSQVTRDHSTVARMVENGLITPEDVYTHPRRNEIYRSLGHHASADLDRFILALQQEDLLLLCSDGLWEMVRDAQIEQIIASTLQQPEQISAALVQAALAGGGKDNISVIVVYIRAEEEAQAAWAAG
jgi:serine/threonine protein phosphatase PrpC